MSYIHCNYYGGCILLPKRHTHGTNNENLPEKFNRIKKAYPEINPNQFGIKHHLESDFHSDLYNSHINKTMPLSPEYS